MVFRAFIQDYQTYSQAGLKIGNMKELPSLQGPQYGTFQKQQLKVFTTLHSSRNLSNPGMQRIWILSLSIRETPSEEWVV